MRAVIWEDRSGRKRRSLVRDDDPDSAAPMGIPANPPDVDDIDWEAVKREIANRLVEEELITWMDVQHGQNRIKGIVLAVLKRRIIHLYRSREKEGRND